MRSLLFVPGDSEKKLEKGFQCGADVVIVDLEDSVAPPTRRRRAPSLQRSSAAVRSETAPKIYVRVNDLSTGLTDDDLAAVIAARPGRHHAAEMRMPAPDVSIFRRSCACTRPKTALPDGADQDHRRSSPRPPPACLSAATLRAIRARALPA